MTPDKPTGLRLAANDNAGTPDPEAVRKVDALVTDIARLIGRQLAREAFAARAAANDTLSGGGP